jgi:hypothetical protein
MVYSESKEIIRAEELLQVAKFEEALQLLNNFEEKTNL